ncbi:Uma2 family endonuclease [Roseimaritima sediminicola]|uniref:Uma2 family endonuclease n=1 Tax=Roseimaritima sediminicola TaxID=2662066 RepID=UPI0012982B0A|nr:Uma2 family endonuclease [Roseimaritima sediminicola]
MSSVEKFTPRYTIDQYAQWQGDWELWEGVAIAMTPSPFGVHQGVVTRLSRVLGNAIEAAACDAEPLVELDWIISNDTVVRPDVLVVCGRPPERHLEQTPTLVAEVLSDSTRQNDLHYKRQLYRRQGVGVYLIVDPATRAIQVDRRQSDGGYRSDTAGSKLDLQLCEDCEIELSTDAFFHR